LLTVWIRFVLNRRTVAIDASWSRIALVCECSRTP